MRSVHRGQRTVFRRGLDSRGRACFSPTSLWPETDRRRRDVMGHYRPDSAKLEADVLIRRPPRRSRPPQFKCFSLSLVVGHSDNSLRIVCSLRSTAQPWVWRMRHNLSGLAPCIHTRLDTARSRASSSRMTKRRLKIDRSYMIKDALKAVMDAHPVMFIFASIAPGAIYWAASTGSYWSGIPFVNSVLIGLVCSTMVYIAILVFLRTQPRNTAIAQHSHMLSRLNWLGLALYGGVLLVANKIDMDIDAKLFLMLLLSLGASLALAIGIFSAAKG